MSNDKAQLPNQIQISDEMPKQVRHDKDVILNSFQNPILNVGRKVPRKPCLLGGDQGAQSKTPFPFREAPPCGRGASHSFDIWTSVVFPYLFQYLFGRGKGAWRPAIKIDLGIPFRREFHVFYHLSRIQFNSEKPLDPPGEVIKRLFWEGEEGDGAEKSHAHPFLPRQLDRSLRYSGHTTKCGN